MAKTSTKHVKDKNVVKTQGENMDKTSEAAAKKTIVFTDKNAKKIADTSDNMQILATENTGYVSQRLANSQKHLYNIAYDVQRELNGGGRTRGKGKEKSEKSEKTIARKEHLKAALSKLQ